MNDIEEIIEKVQQKKLEEKRSEAKYGDKL